MKGIDAPGNEASGAIADLDSAMLRFLQRGIGFASISGNEGPFVRYVADWARSRDFTVDLWESSEDLLGNAPEAAARHVPLRGRPTLVISLAGESTLQSLLFNAHSDVVVAPEPGAWRHDPWAGTLDDGVVFGRGACDVKGGLTSALWALERLRRLPGPRGSVFVELVPGEEDSVGLGTLTSIQRGWRADGAIVIEPTEGLPRCASRSGCRFELEAIGLAIHGTCKWLGVDAITTACAAVGALAEVEQVLGIDPVDPLFQTYPIARPVTVDTLRGGRWQGMICDRCTVAGYLELLPADNMESWQQRFSIELRRALQCRGVAGEGLLIRFGEQYRGHRLSPAHQMCRIASEALVACRHEERFDWAAFNSGCEAGVRAHRDHTPTLVWGPGTLRNAHAVDERVGWDEVRQTADLFTKFADRWTRISR